MTKMHKAVLTVSSGKSSAMGLLSSLLKISSAEDHDMTAIRKALKVYSEYKKRESEASEAERKEAEEALAFLKLNDNNPT